MLISPCYSKPLFGFFMDSLATLEQYYGYTSFRPNQQEAIDSILSGRDAFVLMPTGGGKSLCYAIPSAMMPGTSIVISPLISLMKDQVDGLQANGIPAAFINSSLNPAEQSRVMDQAKTGQLKLLYVAPERLVQPQFLDWLKQLQVNFFAIDEAHCISQWGHDFRPEYRQLSRLRSQFPKIPIMALTATATEQVRQDITQQLHLKSPEVLISSFFRPNLHYSVEPKQQVKQAIVQFIRHRPNQAGIVYCQSRNGVDRLAEYLNRQGISASTYHAGLSDQDRHDHQELFRRDDVQVMVATVAFGMGIDKPNIRFVLHESAPRSLEHYYQETGRAGRDGQESHCVMFFSAGDLQLYRQFSTELPPAEQRASFTKLDQVQQFALSTACRHSQLLRYFNEQRLDQQCTSCDNCLNPREQFDATELCQKILSCIYRLERPYSPTHITTILTGGTNDQITRRNHQQLSVYGIITDYPASQLRQIMLELASRGVLIIDTANYNAVSLTPSSYPILKGQQQVMLSDIFKPRPKKVTSMATSASTAIKYNQNDVDQNLFEKLRQLRKELASQAGVPPYVVFADTSLTDMAIQLPTTLDQFNNIHGVGQQKLEKYGQIFIDTINKYKLSSQRPPS